MHRLLQVLLCRSLHLENDKKRVRNRAFIFIFTTSRLPLKETHMKHVLLLLTVLAHSGYTDCAAPAAKNQTPNTTKAPLPSALPGIPHMNVYITHATFVPTSNNLVTSHEQYVQQEQNPHIEFQSTHQMHQELAIDRQPLAAISENFLGFIKDHKKYLVLSAAIASYVMYWIICYKTNSMLTNQEAWCNWDYQPIVAVSGGSITRALLQKVQNTYSTLYNPTDGTSTPIMLFLKDLDHEITTLQRYLQFMKFGAPLRLYVILPGGDMRTIVQEKIKTLSFLKNVLLEWARAHQNRLLEEGI